MEWLKKYAGELALVGLVVACLGAALWSSVNEEGGRRASRARLVVRGPDRPAPAPDSRVDQALTRLASLEARLAELAVPGDAGPQVAALRKQLDTRLYTLEESLGRLEARLAAPATPSAGEGPGPDAAALEAVTLRLDKVARTLGEVRAEVRNQGLQLQALQGTGQARVRPSASKAKPAASGKEASVRTTPKPKPAARVEVATRSKAARRSSSAARGETPRKTASQVLPGAAGVGAVPPSPPVPAEPSPPGAFATAAGKEAADVARLLRAARLGWFDLVANLVDRGLPVDSRGEGGRTALMEAAAGGHRDIVLLLLDKGARRELRDGDGRRALDAALPHRDDTLLAYLEPLPDTAPAPQVVFRAGDAAY